MNAYQKRHLAAMDARQRAKADRTAASDLKRMEAHAVAKRYEAAHLAATGETTEVRYTNGWFRFRGAMHRKADLERMSAVLEARAAALVNPDEESS